MTTLQELELGSAAQSTGQWSRLHLIVLSVSAGLALDLTTRTDLLPYAQAFNVQPNYTLELLALAELVMTLLAKQLR